MLPPWFRVWDEASAEILKFLGVSKSSSAWSQFGLIVLAVFISIKLVRGVTSSTGVWSYPVCVKPKENLPTIKRSQCKKASNGHFRKQNNFSQTPRQWFEVSYNLCDCVAMALTFDCYARTNCVVVARNKLNFRTDFLFQLLTFFFI